MIAAVFAMQYGPAGPRTALAQSEIGDADLMRASGTHAVSIRARSGGRVTSVPLEVYVARVLAGEGEPGAPPATLEALAVAIRTFAIFNEGRHRREGFDLCDSTHCQVPRAATPAARRAALATAGRILTYRALPAEVFYSSSCGGRSEAASAIWPRANLPYLRSVEDDVHDDDEPWTLELALAGIEASLRRLGFSGTLRDLEVASRTESARVAELRLTGLVPGTISGDRFRLAVGASVVRSTAFSVGRRGHAVRFTGRGYGHGVGMCVIGAGRHARRGESAERILSRYYPGLEIARLRDVMRPQALADGAGSPPMPASGGRAR